MSDTKLYYDATTIPFPLTAGAQGAELQVVATNQSGGPVTLAAVVIDQVPIGSDPIDLLTQADAGAVTAKAPDGWPIPNLANDGTSLQCAFPAPAGTTIADNASLTFHLTGIHVNSATGSFQFTVTEYAGDPPSSDVASKTFEDTKFPSGWGAVTFDLDYSDIQPGGGVTLSWSGPPNVTGATYTINYTLGEYNVTVPQEGQAPLGTTGKYPATPLQLRQTTTFTLNVDYRDSQGAEYHEQIQRTATVAVPPPVITFFTGAIQQVEGKDSLILNWSTENAVTCLIGAIAVGPSGPYTLPLNMSSPTSYTLTATNSSGPATSTLNVDWTVNPAVVSWDRAYSGPSVGGMTLSADNKTAYICTASRNSVVAVDLGAMANAGETSLAPWMESVLFPAAMPDGSLIVCGIGGNGPPVVYAASLTPTGSEGAFGVLPIWVNLSHYATNQGEVLLPLALASSPSQAYVLAADPAPGGRDVFLVNVAGETAPASLSGSILETSAIAISPDGSRAYTAIYTSLQAFDVTVSPPRLLGALSLSSQVTSIAVVNQGRSDILYLAAPNSGSVLTVTGSQASPPILNSCSLQIPAAYRVAASPDGSTLFVLSVAAGSPSNLYVVDLLGSAPVIAAGPIQLPESAVNLAANPGVLGALIAVDGDDSTNPSLYTVFRTVTGGVAQTGDAAVEPERARQTVKVAAS